MTTIATVDAISAGNFTPVLSREGRSSVSSWYKGRFFFNKYALPFTDTNTFSSSNIIERSHTQTPYSETYIRLGSSRKTAIDLFGEMRELNAVERDEYNRVLFENFIEDGPNFFDLL